MQSDITGGQEDEGDDDGNDGGKEDSNETDHYLSMEDTDNETHQVLSKLDWTEEEKGKRDDKLADTELIIDESGSPVVTGGKKKSTLKRLGKDKPKVVVKKKKFHAAKKQFG